MHYQPEKADQGHQREARRERRRERKLVPDRRRNGADQEDKKPGNLYLPGPMGQSVDVRGTLLERHSVLGTRVAHISGICHTTRPIQRH